MEAQLFNLPKLEITNKIRLIELFGGIGSQAMALRDIGADFEHYRLVLYPRGGSGGGNPGGLSPLAIKEFFQPDSRTGMIGR